jgi:hypothetical protein
MHERSDRDRPTLAEIIAYTKEDLATRDEQSGAVHIHIHEAERPEPPPPPEPDIATKYAGHFVLLLGGCVILAIIGVIAAILVPMIMGMLVSLAICAGAFAIFAIAVAAAVKSLGATSESHKINREVVSDLRASRRKGKRR